MAKDSRNGSSGEAIDATERTSLDALIRGRARGVIAAIVEEELEAALGAAESDVYFASRGRGSQVGAWASRQGSVIDGRERLEARAAELDAEFGDAVPRPEFWGGFRLRPDIVEFWEGRPNRLHDRQHFVREPGGGWRSERLSP